MLRLEVADKQGLAWAQEQVICHHYLHKPVDVRCSPLAYHITLFGEKVGCLIFGRPESVLCNGWYGGVEDVVTGKCYITRWQILNLARVYLDPRLQRRDIEGSFVHPQGLVGPSILPFFYDRRHNWRSIAASYVIDMALNRVVYDFLCHKPPVWMEEPFIIREVLSYCDTRIHKGTLYRAAHFDLRRSNKKGIETYARPVRALTDTEIAVIAELSAKDKRCKDLRAKRSQMTLFDVDMLA